MKGRRFFYVIGWAAILIFSCYTPLEAQEKTKTICKNPGAFISISFQDLMSKNIEFTDLASLEKSSYAFGDKSLIYDCIINSFVFAPQKTNDSIVFDPKPEYIKRLKGCPVISNFRLFDPGLVVLGVFYYHMALGDEGRLIAFKNYGEWQLKNAPHSFLGNNPIPDNLDVQQKINYGADYTQKWVIDYPDEYQTMINEFYSCYGNWHEMNPTGGYAGFVQYYSNAFYRNSPGNLVDLLLNYTPIRKSYALTIPDDSTMHLHISEFIKDVYESVYMRFPTDEELNFLTGFIKTHNDLTVKQFYYALLTSNEYKYY